MQIKVLKSISDNCFSCFLRVMLVPQVPLALRVLPDFKECLVSVVLLACQVLRVTE